MNLDLTKHPCFNDKTRHTHGRVHLPVAPKCNLQCNFCNRKYDCVTESRPGVTSSVLSPRQALFYLDEIMQTGRNISVVGIAGPGDPFANANETLRTLRLVREKYPAMLLCVATNGLNLHPWLDELEKLKVSHVTITINAIDTEISSKIYAWTRPEKLVYRGIPGAQILLENQLKALQGLKQRGMTVKINTIVIPGINENHILDVAARVKELGADIFNCIPYLKTEGSAFEHLDEPPAQVIAAIRQSSAMILPLMHHCTRCRADAVGLLAEGTGEKQMQRLIEIKNMPLDPYARKKYIAVASMEGMLVNEHLGRAKEFLIYALQEDQSIVLLEKRTAPEQGGGDKRWAELAALFSDCHTVLVSSAGQRPVQYLKDCSIKTIVLEGLIDEAVAAIFTGKSIAHLTQNSCACDNENGDSSRSNTCLAQGKFVCTGSGEGCG